MNLPLCVHQGEYLPLNLLRSIYNYYFIFFAYTPPPRDCHLTPGLLPIPQLRGVFSVEGCLLSTEGNCKEMKKGKWRHYFFFHKSLVNIFSEVCKGPSSFIFFPTPFLHFFDFLPRLLSKILIILILFPIIYATLYTPGFFCFIVFIHFIIVFNLSS